MRRLHLLSILTVALFAAPASAEITFGFTAAPTSADFVWNPTAAESAGSTTFNVNVGEAVRVSVYLLQTGGDTRISESGVRAAAFDAAFDPTAGQVTGIIGRAFPFAEFIPPSTTVPTNRFPDGPDPTFDNVAGTFSMGGGINSFDTRELPGLGSGEAFVGFFDFEVTRPGAVTFTFSDPNPSPTFSNNTLNNAPAFTDLDGELFANGGVSETTLTLTTTAIPEPSSVMLLSGACGIVLLRRRRR